MNNNSRKLWISVIIALALVLGGSLIGWGFDTVGGTVAVRDVRFIGHDGTLLRGRLYTPDGVTEQNPAPAVLYMQGNDADSDKYSMFSIEFARRGYVVFNYELRGQGFSDSAYDWHPGLPPDPYGFGGPEGLEFLRSLKIVDPDNIALSSHSMGGEVLSYAVQAYPDGYRSFIMAGQNPPKSVTDTTTYRNVAVIRGLDDNQRFKPELLLPMFGVSDMSQVEPGKIYGSFEDGTARAVFDVDVVHNMEYISPTVVGLTIDWIQKTVPAPKEIDPSNQIWMWRYIGTTIAFIGAIFLMLPVGALLLQTSFFKSLADQVPVYKGAKGWAWWVGAFLTAAVGVVGFFWFTRITADVLRFGNLWAIRRANGVMGWALITAAITVVLLLVNRFVLKGDRGATLVNYGLTWEGRGLDWGKIGKSLLLAICILAPIYLLLSVIYPWLLIDFRMWNEILKLLTPARFIRVLQYAPPLFLSYLVLGANLHGFLRAKGGAASIVRETLTNVAIVAPWFYLWWIWIGPAPSYLVTHTAYPFNLGPMYPFVWAFPPIMAVVAVISTYFFRKTGRVYVGAFVNAILVSWMVLAMLSATAA